MTYIRFNLTPIFLIGFLLSCSPAQNEEILVKAEVTDVTVEALPRSWKTVVSYSYEVDGQIYRSIESRVGWDAAPRKIDSLLIQVNLANRNDVEVLEVIKVNRDEKQHSLRYRANSKNDRITTLSNEGIESDSIPLSDTKIGWLSHEEVFGSVSDNGSDLKGVKAVVDVAPRFPEGEQGLISFFKDHSRFAVVDSEQSDIEVYFRFVVRQDGLVDSVKILGSDSDVHAEDIQEMMKEMPNWIPAIKDGQNVSFRVTRRVYFSL